MLIVVFPHVYYRGSLCWCMQRQSIDPRQTIDSDLPRKLLLDWSFTSVKSWIQPTYAPGYALMNQEASEPVIGQQEEGVLKRQFLKIPIFKSESALFLHIKSFKIPSMKMRRLKCVDSLMLHYHGNNLLELKTIFSAKFIIVSFCRKCVWQLRFNYYTE